MSGVGLLLTPERNQVFDFGEWVIWSFRSIVHARPTPEADILGFIKPFTVQVQGEVTHNATYMMDGTYYMVFREIVKLLSFN